MIDGASIIHSHCGSKMVELALCQRWFALIGSRFCCKNRRSNQPNYMATYVLRITSLFLSLLDTFDTPAYELGLSKRRMSPFKICNIESHIAEYLKLDIVVFYDGKIEERLNYLEIDLDVLWRKYGKRICFMRAGRKLLQILETE